MIQSKRLLFTLLLGCGAVLYPSRSALGDNAAVFKDLRIRLVGTAFFQGDATALIEILSDGNPLFVERGDDVRGFVVADILSETIVFSRQNQEYQLRLGEAPPTREIATLRASNSKQAPGQGKSRSISLSGSSRSAVSSSKTFISPIVIAPPKVRVSSGFGRRKDPMGGTKYGMRLHHGIDIAAPYGTKTRASRSGQVIYVGYNSLLGNHVEIKHFSGYTTKYGHLSVITVRRGQSVSQGSTVGLVGSTGRSTGAHLHFEIRKNGIALDPAHYVSSLRGG